MAYKGASSFDRRFNPTASAVFDVPFGKGRRWGKDMPGTMDAVVGAWQLSSIVSLHAGQPLNLRYPDTAGILSDGQADFLGNVALRPNVVDGKAGVRAAGPRDYTTYFNRANLAIPLVTAPFGNLGRNAANGFPLYQTDMVLSKSFRMPFINDGARLQFRGEFYNPMRPSDAPARPSIRVTCNWRSSYSSEALPADATLAFPTCRQRSTPLFSTSEMS